MLWPFCLASGPENPERPVPAYTIQYRTVRQVWTEGIPETTEMPDRSSVACAECRVCVECTWG